MLYIQVLKGPDKGKKQWFHDLKITIGGDLNNDLVLKDPLISPFHAQIEISNNALIYRDLSSLNGSSVYVSETLEQPEILHDRHAIREIEIQDKAYIYLGDTLLEIQKQQTEILESPKILPELHQVFEALVKMGLMAMKLHHPPTAAHSKRVAECALYLAEHYGHFSREHLIVLRYAALLHDLGKILIDPRLLNKTSKIHPEVYLSLLDRLDAAQFSLRSHAQEDLREEIDRQFEHYRKVLKKLQEAQELLEEDKACIQELNALTYLDPRGKKQKLLDHKVYQSLIISEGTLTDEERLKIQKHVVWTQKILSQMPWPEVYKAIPDIAGAHHEWLNGKGYPKGLKANQISESTRIITVCDIVDSLTAKDRTYAKHHSFEEIVRILKKEVDLGHLDSKWVERWIQWHQN